MTEIDRTDPVSYFKQAVAQALHDPQLASEFERLLRDQDRRLPRLVRPTVVTAGIDDDLEGLIPPGSVLLMFAPPGSKALRRIEIAFAASDGDSLRAIQSQLPDVIAQRSVRTVTDAVDQIIALPAYFDFRYASKTLASGAGLVDGLDLGSLLFITNGGSLRSEDFNIVEYHDNTKPLEPTYDYLVVHRQGRLTALEQKILAAVPPDELEFNISALTRGVAFTPVALFVLLVTLTGAACLTLEQELGRVQLTPEQAEKLGARASARELLAMRKEVQDRLGAG